MKIYITGFMGSGKSTYGKELAGALGYGFKDLDVEIEKQANATISAVFNDKGEDEFRKMEQKALLETSGLQDVVIATGGGTPCFFENMQWMNDNGLTVYLKLFESELKRRNEPKMDSRPLLKGLEADDLDNFIYKTLRKRAYFYHRAKIVIDPMVLPPAELAVILKKQDYI